MRILHDWLKLSNWAALFTNQRGLYYDIYALRKQGWCESDCFQEYNKLLKFLNPADAKEKAIWSKMVKIRRNSKPIRVESAFGGLGIYKKEIFLKFDYSPRSNSFLESEHVILHNKIDESFGELFILPNLTNFSWNPHNLARFKLFRKLNNLTDTSSLIRIRKFIRKRLA